MSLPNKLLSDFLEIIKGQESGCALEVGETWSIRNGWNPYYRIGEIVVSLSCDHARRLVAAYRNGRSRFSGGVSFDEVQCIIDGLLPVAAECEAKNARREIPKEAVEVLPPEGRA